MSVICPMCFRSVNNDPYSVALHKEINCPSRPDTPAPSGERCSRCGEFAQFECSMPGCGMRPAESSEFGPVELGEPDEIPRWARGVTQAESDEAREELAEKHSPSALNGRTMYEGARYDSFKAGWDARARWMKEREK